MRAGLYGATRYVAANRADDFCPLQGQPGVTHFGGRLQHSRLLFQLRTQHDCLVGVVLLNRHVQFGLGAGNRVAGVLQLFAANQVGGPQRNTAVKVGLRLGKRGFFNLNAGLQLLAVDHLLARLTHAGGQLGLRFFKRLLGIGLVEGDQRIAFLHVVGVVGPDFRHAAGHLRHNLHLIPCHIRVIGLFEVTQY